MATIKSERSAKPSDPILNEESKVHFIQRRKPRKNNRVIIKKESKDQGYFAKVPFRSTWLGY